MRRRLRTHPSRAGWLYRTALALAVSAALAGSAQAAVFNVTAGDVAGLISAINTANGNGEDDTINLAAGTYTLTAVDNADEGPSGLPSITSTIEIVGAGAASTIIERDSGAPDFRVVSARAAHDLTIRGVTIRNGQTPAEGGGIRARDGRLIIEECVITANAAGWGGGVEFFAEDGAIIDSDVSGNVASPGNGGGVRFVARYDARVLRTTITGNQAGSGGGIEAGSFPGETGSLTVSDSTVSNNAVTSNAGGGIQNYDALLIVNRTTISGNTNHFPGGSVTAWGSRLLINASTISNNLLADGVQLIGGPLYVPSGRSAEITATNSTFSGNSFSAFTFIGGKNELELVSSTVTGNGRGFHLSTSESVTLRSTIVTDNTDGTCDAKIQSQGHNILDSTPACKIASKSSDLIDADPLLGPLANNGGPTETHALLPGSPALDAGASCAGLDQRGLQRPADGNGDTAEVCDIGAVESGAALVVHAPDHFLCYSAKAAHGTPAFAGTFGINLADAFETKPFDARKGRGLCVPTDQHDAGIVDDSISVRSYDLALPTTELPHAPQLGVEVRNQLGQLVVDTIKVERLLVPSTTSVTAPPAPPLASNVDTFKCYKIRVSPQTAKLPKGLSVDVRNAFERRLFDVVKPTRLCLAANRDGGGILHPADHLMCYQVKLAKPQAVGAVQAKHAPVDIFTANDLDDEALTTSKAEELCIPSSITP